MRFSSTAAAFVGLAALACAEREVREAPVPAGVGAPCARAEECASGSCDLQVPGGACALTCVDNTGCPVGTACTQLGFRESYCVPVCASGEACRDGYDCSRTFGVCAPRGRCGRSSCRPAETCAEELGWCTGAVRVSASPGGACRVDAECGGRGEYCLLDIYGFPGGVCTAPCTDDLPCVDGSVCARGVVRGGVPGGGTCARACDGDDDCRKDYLCVDHAGSRFCHPRCTFQQDCLDPVTEECDVASGRCVPRTARTPATLTSGPLPQVVNLGGPILRNPLLVPIFFTNEDEERVASLIDFYARVGDTEWWSAVATEYGVGPARSAPPVRLGEPGVGTLAEESIGGWIEARVASGVLPAPTPDTLYVLHFPDGMSAVLGGTLSCVSFGAYHADYVRPGGAHVAYAVMPYCSFSGLSYLDSATVAASHELIEAATDPFPFHAPAFGRLDDEYGYWNFAIVGGEVGDLCFPVPEAFVREHGLLLQRSWSNAAVTAGAQPCVPAPADVPYLVAVPRLFDALDDLRWGERRTWRGVRVGPEPREFELELHGSATGFGSVSVESLRGLRTGWDIDTFQVIPNFGWAGDRLRVRVTRATWAEPEPALFRIVTTIGDARQEWYGVAGP